MSVFFNLQAQRELLGAYASAQELIGESLAQIRDQTREADDLIDASRAVRAVVELQHTALGLANDRVDLAERAALLLSLIHI